jgi:hypothetical protein
MVNNVPGTSISSANISKAHFGRNNYVLVIPQLSQFVQLTNNTNLLPNQEDTLHNSSQNEQKSRDLLYLYFDAISIYFNLVAFLVICLDVGHLLANIFHILLPLRR